MEALADIVWSKNFTIETSKALGPSSIRFLSFVLLEAECLVTGDVGADKGRAPKLFNVFHDQVGTGEMIDARRSFGVIHCVRHVAHQGNVLAKFHHLPDGKWTTEYAHVKVHSA